MTWSKDLYCAMHLSAESLPPPADGGLDWARNTFPEATWHRVVARQVGKSVLPGSMDSFDPAIVGEVRFGVGADVCDLPERLARELLPNGRLGIAFSVDVSEATLVNSAARNGRMRAIGRALDPFTHMVDKADAPRLLARAFEYTIRVPGSDPESGFDAVNDALSPVLFSSLIATESETVVTLASRGRDEVVTDGVRSVRMLKQAGLSPSLGRLREISDTRILWPTDRARLCRTAAARHNRPDEDQELQHQILDLLGQKGEIAVHGVWAHIIGTEPSRADRRRINKTLDDLCRLRLIHRDGERVQRRSSD